MPATTSGAARRMKPILRSAHGTEVFPYFSFFLPPQQEVICYPIAGFNDDLRPGHRRFNFIWYRVADADVAEGNVRRRPSGHQHDYSVPPPLIRKDLIAGLRDEG